MPKKSFFTALTRVGFWLVAYVLCIFQARYAYKKCLLESNGTFGIIWKIIRYVEMIIWQEKAIFVDFKKMTLRNSKNSMSDAKEKLFSSLDEGWFLARSSRSMCLLCTLCIQKMFIRVQENFQYKLEDHTTCTNGYMAGESDFCRL